MIVSLNDPKGEELKLTGGKGASLTRMARAGLPIPEGFVVTTEAYNMALAESGVDKLIEKELANLDYSDNEAVKQVSTFIRSTIESIEMPSSLEKQITEFYEKLCPGNEPVAVRSSATAEDLPEASFAGQQETYLVVVTAKNVIQRIKSCWASCFTDRAIAYRVRHNITDRVAGAVVVQKLIESEKSGVMFTVNPVTKGDQVVVEACWGLGEALVSGVVTPDQYIIDKKSGKVLTSSILPKTTMIVRGSSETISQPVPPDKVRAQVLNGNELNRLNEVAKKLEEFFGGPQDVEWAIKFGKVYLLQSRPVTTV
jgi:pyruvate, water dikinase